MPAALDVGQVLNESVGGRFSSRSSGDRLETCCRLPQSLTAMPSRPRSHSDQFRLSEKRAAPWPVRWTNDRPAKRVATAAAPAWEWARCQSSAREWARLGMPGRTSAHFPVLNSGTGLAVGNLPPSLSVCILEPDPLRGWRKVLSVVSWDRLRESGKVYLCRTFYLVRKVPQDKNQKRIRNSCKNALFGGYAVAGIDIANCLVVTYRRTGLAESLNGFGFGTYARWRRALPSCRFGVRMGSTAQRISPPNRVVRIYSQTA